ncbi:hypothetical protein B0T14DRAFT_565235 [Immersiella caudata]|uniref:DUF7143 domain-containing protein n=1 Tax=Immersiella caudata TaxID=314043 RepID=A0AA39WYE0_9PEZI|nr:hypothetical protein B0T14DRAFT_565235 [Immersiella caudata]
MKFSPVILLGATVVLGAPASLLSERQTRACFIVGSEVLPAEVANIVTDLQPRITCDPTQRTLSGVPDVSSGDVSFSSINFATSGQSALEFALDRFATRTPLASNDLATFQSQLDVYLATEAGIRSAGGNLAIKVPKFFLEFQISRIQTAQGNPPTAPGLQVDHKMGKVLKNAGSESQALLDQVAALGKVLS